MEPRGDQNYQGIFSPESIAYIRKLFDLACPDNKTQSEKFEELINEILTQILAPTDDPPPNQCTVDIEYCPHCGTDFENRSLLDMHIRLHTESFTDSTDYKPHVLSHAPLYCANCQLTFASPEAALDHFNTCIYTRQHTSTSNRNYDPKPPKLEPLDTLHVDSNICDNELKGVNIQTSNVAVDERNFFSNNDNDVKPVAVQMEDLNVTNYLAFVEKRLQTEPNANEALRPEILEPPQQSILHGLPPLYTNCQRHYRLPGPWENLSDFSIYSNKNASNSSDPSIDLDAFRKH